MSGLVRQRRLVCFKGTVADCDDTCPPLGHITYLSTAGVVAQAVSDAKTAGTPLGKVGIIAFSDHADRAVLTAQAAHLVAGVPTGVKLPDTYDPGSGQSWTTNRLSYVETDLADRILTLG